MKPLLLSILAMFAFVLSPLRAQQKQPPPPPVSVFPLGGLTASGPSGDYKDEFPLFGFNMWYNGSPAQLNPGQGAIGDIGGGDATIGGLSLDGAFFPKNVYNPYFFEADADLVSNESGLSAWDLNNAWYTPQWVKNTTYQPGNLITDVNGIEWTCVTTNTQSTFAATTTSGNNTTINWAQVQTPMPWVSGQSYSNSNSAGLADYVTFAGTLWRCTTTSTTAAPEDAHWSVWMNPAVWNTGLTCWKNEYALTTDDGNLWQCRIDESTAQKPAPGASDWTLIHAAPKWTMGNNYSSGDYVFFADASGRDWIYYSLSSINNDQTPPGNNDWAPAIWVANPHDNSGIPYNQGDLVCFYQDPLNPNPFYQSPDANSAWPIRNTIWVAHEQNYVDCGWCANLGQSPIGGPWVQLAPKTGQQVPPAPAIGEWQIAQGDDKINNISTGIYLDYTFNAVGPWTSTGDFLGGNKALYLDFIYSLDPSKYSGTDDLFNITATAQLDDGTTLTAPGNDTAISIADYTNYANGGTYSTSSLDSHWGNDVKTENPRILKFPDKTLTGINPDPNQYAVRRLGFELPAGSTAHITSVHFTLKKTAKSNGIFVRGVRLRTEDMDLLLRGKLNAPNSNFYWPPTTTTTWAGLTSGTNGLFQTIKNNFDTKYASFGAAAAWSNWLGIQVGNEMNWNAFRVYAYIDSLWRQWTRVHTRQQKDLYQILTGGNQTYYRAIFEDQNGYHPLINQEQGLWEYLGSPQPPYTADHIPASVLFDPKNPSNPNPNFASLGWPIAYLKVWDVRSDVIIPNFPQ